MQKPEQKAWISIQENRLQEGKNETVADQVDFVFFYFYGP